MIPTKTHLATVGHLRLVPDQRLLELGGEVASRGRCHRLAHRVAALVELAGCGGEHRSSVGSRRSSRPGQMLVEYGGEQALVVGADQSVAEDPPGLVAQACVQRGG